MAEDQDKPKLQTVDINDLSLADEELSVNADADAFQGPPPPDDGDHRVKLRLGDRKVQMGKSKDGRNYFMVHIDAEVLDPEFEGRRVFDNASSLIMQSSGTCRIAGVLKAIGETVPSRTTAKELTKALVDRLAGDPEATITTVWEAYCSDCKKNVLRQQKRFPTDNGSGRHTSQIECPKCHSLCSAQARVTAYKAAGAGAGA